jgi:hypothetical protein
MIVKTATQTYQVVAASQERLDDFMRSLLLGRELWEAEEVSGICLMLLDEASPSSTYCGDGAR